jgi:hypothetical protein
MGFVTSKYVCNQFSFLLPATVNDPSLIGCEVADWFQRKSGVDAVPNRSVSG